LTTTVVDSSRSPDANSSVLQGIATSYVVVWADASRTTFAWTPGGVPASSTGDHRHVSTVPASVNAAPISCVLVASPGAPAVMPI
jgi:hypothetical protein